MEWTGRLVFEQRKTRRFLKLVGITTDPYTDPEGFMRSCNDRNPRFQNDQSIHRLDLPDNMAEWNEDLADATHDLYTIFEMARQEHPLSGDFHWILCPGGNRWSPWDRSAHAAEQVNDAKAVVEHGIIITGSTRPLNDKDRRAAQDYAVGAETEFDLCLGAASKLLARYPHLPIITVRKDDPRSGNDGVIDRVMEEIGGGKDQSFGIVTTAYYYVEMCLDAARAKKRHQWRSVRVAGHATTPWMLSERTDPMKFSECLVTLYKAAQALAAGC